MKKTDGQPNGIQGIRKRFLTKAEAAYYLGITLTALDRLCFNRRIRFYKVANRHVYFDVEDLDAYIMSGEVVEVEKNVTRGGVFGREKKE